MLRRILYVLFLAYILADTGYSFLQHFHTPLDGSMPGGIVPSEAVKEVLESPLGMKVFIENTSYPDPIDFIAFHLNYRQNKHI